MTGTADFDSDSKNETMEDDGSGSVNQDETVTDPHCFFETDFEASSTEKPNEHESNTGIRSDSHYFLTFFGLFLSFIVCLQCYCECFRLIWDKYR